MERIQQEIRLLQRSSEDSANVSDKLNKEVSERPEHPEYFGPDLTFSEFQLVSAFSDPDPKVLANFHCWVVNFRSRILYFFYILI